MEGDPKIEKAAQLIEKASVLIFCIPVSNEYSQMYLNWGVAKGIPCLIYSPENKFMKRLARQPSLVVVEIDADDVTRKQSAEITRQYGATRIRIEEVASISKLPSVLGSMIQNNHHVCISGSSAKSVLMKIDEYLLQKKLGRVMDRKRLEGSELKDVAQCRACLATFPRNSFDWSKAKTVQIGTNDSWGNWNVYSNFVECRECKELAVGDEVIVTGK